MSSKTVEFWKLSQADIERELGKISGSFEFCFCVDQLPDALLPDLSSLSVHVTLSIDMRRALVKDAWWGLERSLSGEALHVGKTTTDSLFKILAYVSGLSGVLTNYLPDCRNRPPTSDYVCVPKALRLSVAVTDESGDNYEWRMEKKLFQDSVFWRVEHRDAKLKELKQANVSPGRYTVLFD